MITLRNLQKSFGAQTLFDDASLQINFGDRFALVGPNGAGKSTLFKLIMGAEPADAGEISLRDGIRFGYLPQETPSLSGKTALEETLGEEGDSRREAQAKKILMGLGFRVTDFERPVSEFSGGWQMRIMIAKLLLEEPDLLMLDEPTNHLDLEALLWFQNYLRSYRGSLFVISHDREFIDGVTTRIVETNAGKLKIYNGSYEDYVEQKKQEADALVGAWKRQQKEIEDLEIFISRFRAKASLAASVQSKIKYLERMEKIVLPPEDKTVGFAFPQPARAGQVVMNLKSIRMSYDGTRFIYDGLDLELERGQRIALVGPNGAGKSTLIKLLAGAVPFQGGERKIGFNVEVGYFSQHRAQMFKEGRTVFQEAADTRRAHSETGIRTVLGSFLFQGDTVNKKVEVLSGGEKSRLGLAKLLLDPPNVMLMDEPTTHLDIASVDMLIQALRNYEGTLCLISHDVYFLRQLANNVIHVKEGKVTWYPGDYDYFLHKKSLEDSEEAELFRTEQSIEAAVHRPGKPAKAAPKPAEAATPATPAAATPAPAAGGHDWSSGGSGYKTKEQKRKEAEERNARYRDKSDKKKVRNQREELELEQHEILRDMGKPETHKDPKKVTELMKRLGEIKKELSSHPGS